VEDFEEWVAARSASLARTAYLLTGDTHAAEDLLQEALARVAQKWARLNRSGNPDAYVRRVLHNLSVDRWRRRKSRPSEVLSEAPVDRFSDGDEQGSTERRLVLAEALGRLTPKQRAVLSLRFYEDLTETQTAAILGCSVNTVKSQTRAALTRIRQVAPDLLEPFGELSEAP
jgi:RNA polymerase sigma-70 factor (sigma-E family)